MKSNYSDFFCEKLFHLTGVIKILWFIKIFCEKVFCLTGEIKILIYSFKIYSAYWVKSKYSFFFLLKSIPLTVWNQNIHIFCENLFAVFCKKVFCLKGEIEIFSFFCEPIFRLTGQIKIFLFFVKICPA